MKKLFFNSQDAGKFFLFSVIAPQLLALIAELILLIVANLCGTTTEKLLKIPSIVIVFSMIAQLAFLFVITYCGRNHSFKSAYHFSFHIPATNIIIATVIGVLGVFTISPVVSLFNDFLASIGYNLSSIGFEQFLSQSIWYLILAIILMAFVPAVLEELIFRGAILQGLRRYGKWVAIFATSALFMLIHCNIQQLIYPFIISIIMCNCVLKTDNILTSMIVHFVANTTSLIATYCGLNIVFGLPLWANILLSIAIGVIGFLAMWWLTTLLKKQPQTSLADKCDNSFTDENIKPNNNLTIGIIIAVLFYIIAIAVGFTSAT